MAHVNEIETIAGNRFWQVLCCTLASDNMALVFCLLGCVHARFYSVCFPADIRHKIQVATGAAAHIEEFPGGVPAINIELQPGVMGRVSQGR